MMKKFTWLCLLIALSFVLVGCDNVKNKDINAFSGVAFKEMFESLNDIKDLDGNEYFDVSISGINPFVIVDNDYLVNEVKDGVVFVGDHKDFYTRVVMKYLMKSVASNDVAKVFFLNVNDMKDFKDKIGEDFKRIALVRLEKGSVVDKVLLEDLDIKLNKELDDDTIRNVEKRFNLFFQK